MLLKYVFLLAFSCVGVTMQVRAADQLPGDVDFVTKAEQSGNQEVADALSAIAMSKNLELHKLAEQMHKDGTAVNQRLAELSIEKGWPTPALNPPDTMNVYSDHRYVVRQIKGLHDALIFYAEEAANGADTELQEFARDRGAILRERLESLRLLRTA